MNRNDAFMLDGLRLLRVDSVTFLTEQGYIHAKTHYAGDVLQYFDVCYPDGKIAVFGYKDNTENQLYYPLTELSDLWGNTITYQYSFNYEHNHYQVQKINYNGASVEFGYERRPDCGLLPWRKGNHRKYPVADYYLQFRVERIREIHAVIPKRGTSYRKTELAAKHYL